MDLPGNNRDDFKSEQAIDDFYKHTSYDRGHLNPNNYQCDRGRLATFTLTNAVPMDPCFNQQHWKQYEDEIKRIVKHYYGKGLPYFVTGVVPSSEKIPVPILDTVEHDRDFSMVTVPSHVWTALCFDANKKEESFSLGYIGENKPEALINILSIHDLEQQLIGLYGISNFRIFHDDCGSSNKKSEQYLKHLLTKIYIPQHRKAGALDNNLSTKARNALNTLILNKRRRTSSQQSHDQVEILDVVVEMEYSKMSEWFESNEIFKSYTNTACRFTSKTDLPSHHHIEVRSAKNINDHTCTLVSEKSSPQSVITADGTRCLEGETCSGSCKTTKGSKLCCTTPCLYNPDSKLYTCASGHQSIECSPQYSTITKSGKSCRKDHECGLYGETKYWCYTEGTHREFCNPPFGTVSVESLDPLKSYIDTEKGVALIADNGMFWCSNGDINYKIEAAKIYNDDWCKFKVSRADNSNILLRDKRGRYLSRIHWSGIDYIHASKLVPDVFCEFQVFIEDEKVLFKADNGKMLSRVYRNGKQNIEAAKDAPDVFCKFTVSSGGTTEKDELRK